MLRVTGAGNYSVRDVSAGVGAGVASLSNVGPGVAGVNAVCPPTPAPTLLTVITGQTSVTPEGTPPPTPAPTPDVNDV